MAKLDTLCVHAGHTPGKGEPRQIPIIQSTTFKYETSDQMARLFDLQDAGYFYSRLQNPTVDQTAAQINALEGGVGAILTSSGQAANLFAVINIAGAGDHIIAANNIYGGTFNLLGVTLPKFGIDITFLKADATDAEIEAAIRPNTKLIFGETLSNPGVEVFDLERWASTAHRNGLPLIVDNTFPTPILCRPFEWGADIVTHSTTKYIDGHGVSVGGAVVDSGNFPWDKYPERFPGLTRPDESYHGLTYTKAFGKSAYIVKATTHLMRDLGAIQSPQNAFYLHLGLQTLHLRMKRHSESALKVARWLQACPDVAWVHYPGLSGDPLVKKYLPDGCSGVMAFGLKGGRAFDNRFLDALKLITIETHVADCHTCVLHPASHTHRQLSDEQLKAAGIAPDLIRLSIGLEAPEDIIEDLEQALNAARQ
ncbi:MAG: O-acetylhomoserine aminocarboxypropyltransferase/cysteine synthase [Bacteroidales bacterium]|nr:O-acetylhomoserine aminocarboxypropyltransferase/cysteine synthase [Bacteroidales bacterium]MBR1783269.1 O-acetylhomoserine aminocarboxypropyltransferase/cysteine synthase [Bacteroidales bacterium]